MKGKEWLNRTVERSLTLLVYPQPDKYGAWNKVTRYTDRTTVIMCRIVLNTIQNFNLLYLGGRNKEIKF